MDVDQLRLSVRLPLAAATLEVAHQPRLLDVDRDDPNAKVDDVIGLGVDVLKLGVAIRVLRALD